MIHDFLLQCTRGTIILFKFLIKNPYLASGQHRDKSLAEDLCARKEFLLKGTWKYAAHCNFFFFFLKWKSGKTPLTWSKPILLRVLEEDLAYFEYDGHGLGRFSQ